MVKTFRTGLLFLAGLSMACLSYSLLAYAESDTAIGQEAKSRLNFQVKIPQVLSLNIGSKGGAVDLITFQANLDASAPGNASIPLSFGALVGDNSTVALSSDSSIPMVGAQTGAEMPLSTIATTGTGSFQSINNVPFDGTNHQVMWQDSGKGLRQGNLSYHYTYNTAYPPDSYTGQVTYTLSSP